MILFMFNADPRQSAVTLLSSTEQNVVCLIVISGMEANSKEHVGRVTMIPPLHAQEPDWDRWRGRRILPVMWIHRPVPRI